MIILGIETSCDETAAAVVQDGTKILSSVVATSADMHAKTGGIIPEQAARQQVKSIIPVINEALKIASQNSKSKTQNKSPITNHQSLITKIDAIAVTVGPGLIGSLLVGVETAKTLAYLWKKPIVPVNHLVAHIYANWFGSEPQFPTLALVVSGGHTDLVLMKSHGDIKWLGGTRDDAAGECFDKCARLLGLPYPGGPAISKQAEKFFNSQRKACYSLSTSNFQLSMFPRPMSSKGQKDNFDFSFSGLKTSVLNYLIKNKLTNQLINQLTKRKLSAEIQEAIVDCLVKKTMMAVKKFVPKTLLLAGGVAANSRLREKLRTTLELETHKTSLFIPNPILCTDNAAYIASCAFYNYNPIDWKNISANPQLTISDKT